MVVECNNGEMGLFHTGPGSEATSTGLIMVVRPRKQPDKQRCAQHGGNRANR